VQEKDEGWLVADDATRTQGHAVAEALGVGKAAGAEKEREEKNSVRIRGKRS